MQWILNELKKYKVIADDIKLDTRMFAIRSADHVNYSFGFLLNIFMQRFLTKIFELLGRLVAHDVWFIWDRIGYLSNKDEDILLQIPFSVIFRLKYQLNKV